MGRKQESLVESTLCTFIWEMWCGTLGSLKGVRIEYLAKLCTQAYIE